MATTTKYDYRPAALMWAVVFLAAALRPNHVTTWIGFWEHLLSLVTGIAVGAFWQYRKG